MGKALGKISARRHLKRRLLGRGVKILLDVDGLSLGLLLLRVELAVFLVDGALEDVIGSLIFRIDREELFAPEEIDDHDDEFDEEIERAENADDGDADEDEGEEDRPKDALPESLQRAKHAHIIYYDVQVIKGRA